MEWRPPSPAGEDRNPVTPAVVWSIKALWRPLSPAGEDRNMIGVLDNGNAYARWWRPPLTEGEDRNDMYAVACHSPGQ